MHIKHYTASLTFIFLLLLSGCGGGGSSKNSANANSVPSAPQAFTTEEKLFVHELFQTEYLWFDQVVSDIDYDAYTTPQSLVDALKVTPPDRWSFAITAQEYARYTSQQTSGFGFYLTNNFQILMTLPGSPADGKLLRGDIILKINGNPVSIDAVLSAAGQQGKAATFTVSRQGSTLDVTVTPKAYTYRVTRSKIIDNGGYKVGYLFYDAFTGNSVSEIEDAFTLFKHAGVNRLVIDLRYNGGGDIAAASALLDNITNAHPGATQFYLDWNENYKQNNTTYTFEDADLQDGNELNLPQVVFLVTRESASASEAVISALKPYLGNANVITVGSATHGKNVGMSGRSYGSDYYFLINFYVKNAAGQTSSPSGIAPTCPAVDDLDHQLGDPSETMFKTALHYIATGSCL